MANRNGILILIFSISICVGIGILIDYNIQDDISLGKSSLLAIPNVKNIIAKSSTNASEAAGIVKQCDDASVVSQFDSEIRLLLSHVLVTITYLCNEGYDNNGEAKYLSHTLGTIREWWLLPQVGNVTIVIVTNDKENAQKIIGTNDWFTFHQVNVPTKQQFKDTNIKLKDWNYTIHGNHPYHMPFYHREVIADYLDHRDKNGTNMTDMLNEELPSPTSYAFFEADNVLDKFGLLSWAEDTALLHNQGIETTKQQLRHFFRWEYSTKKDCPVFTGQTKPIPRNSIIMIGGKEFIPLTGGRWAGMYVLPAEHMIEYYNSGSFWNIPQNTKYAREIQLHDIVHGSDELGRQGNDMGVDNTLVPVDEMTGTVSLSAGVHHQSDKYSKKKWGKFGKLCINDLFI